MRKSVILIAALLSAAPMGAVAQERGPFRDGQREGPRREQTEERRSIGTGEAVQRASAGRAGRYLGASNRGDVIVVRWEYPGGRVADILVDARSGRVIGER